VALEPGRRAVAGGGVPAPGVVRALDAREERRPRLGVRAKDVPIRQLAVQGGEARFGDGAVGAVAHPPHRRPDPGLLAALPGRHARLLAAVVGMLEHAGLRPTVPACHARGRHDELRTGMVGHGPADDAPAAPIEDDREIPETSPGRHVRNVRRPHHSGGRRHEPPMDKGPG